MIVETLRTRLTIYTVFQRDVVCNISTVLIPKSKIALYCDFMVSKIKKELFLRQNHNIMLFYNESL